MKVQWPYVALVLGMMAASLLVFFIPHPPDTLRGAALALFVAVAGAAPAVLWGRKTVDVNVTPSDKDELH